MWSDTGAQAPLAMDQEKCDNLLGLTLSEKFAWFLCVYSTSLLITLWEKEKLLVTSDLSFSHCVFYPFRELSEIKNCRLPILSVWKSPKFVVWERDDITAPWYQLP